MSMNERRLADTIGTVALVLGLVFVGFEMRQNTKAVRSQTIQGIAELSIQGMALGVQNKSLREAFTLAMSVGPDALTPEQAVQMSWFTGMSLRVAEDRYHQLQLGTISDSRIVGGGIALYRSYYFRHHWETRRREDYEGTGFGAWVERELIPLTPREPPALVGSGEGEGAGSGR